VHNRLSKNVLFLTIIEGKSAEILVRLFRDNIWKLHRLLESVILVRKSQFVADLNSILKIKTRL